MKILKPAKTPSDYAFTVFALLVFASFFDTGWNMGIERNHGRDKRVQPVFKEINLEGIDSQKEQTYNHGENSSLRH